MKSKKIPARRKWQFSHWAALSLLAGLVACIVAMVYVSVRPDDTSDVDDIIERPVPETPYVSPPDGHIDVGSMLDKIWASTVWIGRETKPGVNFYVGTGWVIGNKDGKSYIVTCAHVATHRTDLPLNLGYLGKSGQWSIVPAQVVRKLDGRSHGDVAIMSVNVVLPPIKFATLQNTYAPKDEIFIAGVQWIAPPAIISAGVITKADPANHKFEIKGWDWYGFSGGPIVLRKTGLVIGYTAMSADGHRNDAMKSNSFDLTHLIGLLRACGLAEFIQE